MTSSPIAEPGRAPVDSIVDLARRAPSVHNTQPWRWQATEHGLELWADWSRHLAASDPDGRNLVISCGAALHHTLVAARALGWTPVVDHFPDATREHLLARVSLNPAPGVPAESSAWLRAIDERCTDRRRFTSWPVPVSRLEQLTAPAQHHGAEVLVITEEQVRNRLDLLISRAMLAQEHDIGIRREEEIWVRRRGEDGLTDPSDLPWGDGHGRRYRTRFDHDAQPPPVRARHPVERTDGVLVIGTTCDGPMSWLNAGEALSVLWLEATIHGLSVVPLSQVVEVEETRVALRHEVLDGRLEGQIVVRIGWQQIGRSGLERSPRRPVENLLGT